MLQSNYPTRPKTSKHKNRNYRRILVGRLDGELLIGIGHVPDLAPREPDLRSQSRTGNHSSTKRELADTLSQLAHYVTPPDYFSPKTSLRHALSTVETFLSDYRTNSKLENSLVGLVVNAQAERVDAEEQFRSFLVRDLEIVHAVHLQILSDLQIFDHAVLAQHILVRLVHHDDFIDPLLDGHFVLVDNPSRS